jgi:hypothetical protein
VVCDERLAPAARSPQWPASWLLLLPRLLSKAAQHRPHRVAAGRCGLDFERGRWNVERKQQFRSHGVWCVCVVMAMAMAMATSSDRVIEGGYSGSGSSSMWDILGAAFRI